MCHQVHVQFKNTSTFSPTKNCIPSSLSSSDTYSSYTRVVVEGPPSTGPKEIMSSISKVRSTMPIPTTLPKRDTILQSKS
ncbi:unnamed protein product [Musa acuminata subsp. burmannicoides]